MGTDKFTDKIKKRYLPDVPIAEIPHQKQLSKNVDPEVLLLKAAKILKSNPEHYRKTARIAEADKLNRDLLIYLMWQLGRLTNQQIGEKFGLSYSAVSKRVGIFKDMLRKNRSLQTKLNRIKSKIKV